jgi:hypothetical protein
VRRWPLMLRDGGLLRCADGVHAELHGFWLRRLLPRTALARRGHAGRLTSSACSLRLPGSVRHRLHALSRHRDPRQAPVLVRLRSRGAPGPWGPGPAHPGRRQDTLDPSRPDETVGPGDEPGGRLRLRPGRPVGDQVRRPVPARTAADAPLLRRRLRAVAALRRGGQARRGRRGCAARRELRLRRPSRPARFARERTGSLVSVSRWCPGGCVLALP